MNNLPKCKLAKIKNAFVRNIKTGTTLLTNIEYYENRTTGKMMFSGSFGYQRKHFIAKNCEILEEPNFSIDVRIA